MDECTNHLHEQTHALRTLELILTTLASVFFYYLVQGSSPGYVTQDHANHIETMWGNGDSDQWVDEMGLAAGRAYNSGEAEGVELMPASSDRVRVDAGCGDKDGNSNDIENGNGSGGHEGPLNNLEGRLTWHGGAELGPTYRGVQRKSELARL